MSSGVVAKDRPFLHVDLTQNEYASLGSPGFIGCILPAEYDGNPFLRNAHTKSDLQEVRRSQNHVRNW